MNNNLLNYLDETVVRVPDKIAFADQNEKITFEELFNQSRAIASYLLDKKQYKCPVVIFMDKGPKMIASMLGIIAAGCFYVPIDVDIPKNRIQLILNNVKSSFAICSEKTKKIAESFQPSVQVLLDVDMIIHTKIEVEKLKHVRAIAIDTDPIYIVFTSGSTGIPKGVVGNHRAIIEYIEQLTEIMKFSGDTIFGNQTPLYVDACFKEVFSTLKVGATTYLFPKSLFVQPVKLVECLNQYKVNTICWVASALKMISGFGTFQTIIPQYLHTIAFGSEVFPAVEYNEWKKALPHATFTNLYGPTEGTGTVCYYRVEREISNFESIPIGKAFSNTEILLINDKNEQVKKGEQGEICIRGTSLTYGYFNDKEKTKECFVQNPLNEAYPELIYRTGDIGKYNEIDELLFVSRKDYQIKHMGHRIELGEIEMNTNMLDGVDNVACIYDIEKQKIVLFYTGKIESSKLKIQLKGILPRYMLPSYINKRELITLTPNGKVDRMLLKKIYKEKKRG